MNKVDGISGTARTYPSRRFFLSSMRWSCQARRRARRKSRIDPRPLENPQPDPSNKMRVSGTCIGAKWEKAVRAPSITEFQ